MNDERLQYLTMSTIKKYSVLSVTVELNSPRTSTVYLHMQQTEKEQKLLRRLLFQTSFKENIETNKIYKVSIMSNSLQSIIMKFHFFCYITAIVLVKLNSIYSMFWHVRITVYLKEKEPNYHVHRYICSISCKHRIWGHVILPKNIQKTFSKFIKKTVYFPLWNRVLWGRIRLCIII